MTVNQTTTEVTMPNNIATHVAGSMICDSWYGDSTQAKWLSRSSAATLVADGGVLTLCRRKNIQIARTLHGCEASRGVLWALVSNW
eukprot:CAMPEP_0174358952 /NCGR_PEP_ID=MMETSP0811_2-20130205/45557_1 /TAXON_ID=73025 ORGANISM="Eutreptiella gymnastica-like, Strain CCMP1594" /NCGR_SAMPLE_ID=MMETSP0811_2 /ASSEMBLY_ACC=CAM_ASM_000667 /LENGTH=85 /DNA_ID=CAMNT_0015493157 /DNA_START=82 /DNA_END=336 /DNA_ORIENTATION=+